MDRIDTILTLQRINKINILEKDILNHDILYKLIAPFVYESHRHKIYKEKYILEFTYSGLNIKFIDDFSILFNEYIKTAEGETYLYYEWKDLKNDDIAQIIDIVVEKNLTTEPEPENQCEYEIRIYKSPEYNEGYIAEVPEFKNCFAKGKTQEEALKNIKENMKYCLATCISSPKKTEAIPETVYDKSHNPEPYENKETPTMALNQLKQNIKNIDYSAIQVFLTDEEIKGKIKELGLHNLNYKA